MVGADRVGEGPAPSSVGQVGGQAACSARTPDSSATVASTASALREAMTTSAPAATKPPAIIRPMPREPPVTTTVLSATSKRSAGGVGAVGSVMGGDGTPRRPEQVTSAAMGDPTCTSP